MLVRNAYVYFVNFFISPQSLKRHRWLMDLEEHNRFVTKLSPPFGHLALNSDLF